MCGATVTPFVWTLCITVALFSRFYIYIKVRRLERVRILHVLEWKGPKGFCWPRNVVYMLMLFKLLRWPYGYFLKWKKQMGFHWLKFWHIPLPSSLTLQKSKYIYIYRKMNFTMLVVVGAHFVLKLTILSLIFLFFLFFFICFICF